MPPDELERKLRLGDSFPLELAGKSGAGYRWSFTIDDPLVVVVTRVLDASGADARSAAPGDPNVERFVVTARASGSTAVRFALGRVFEPGKAPIERYEIDVRVT